MVDKEQSSSSEKVGTDNGSGGNGQSFSDQERESAQSALTEFNNSNYGACVQLLSKLEGSCGQDPKVAHNKAVAEYFKSDFKKTEAFRKSLFNICNQVHVNLDDPGTLEDVDQCILFYNYAVLLFHQNQYNAALSIISKVFSFIEPLEENLAHCVCILFLELLLRTHQPEQALAQIAYMETQFVATTTSMKLAGDKDLYMSLDKTENKEKTLEPLDVATDVFKQKLVRCRILCYLKTQALRSCKRELKTLSSSKVPALLTIFLKGNLEYLKGNFQKAVKALNLIPRNLPSIKETGDCIPALFYNNMGCLHHYVAKPHLASHYLQRALQEDESAMKSMLKHEGGEAASSRPLFTLNSSKRLEIKYNLGITLLHAGEPVLAFEYLTEAVQVYHMNPRLWLRLAECCIMVHKAGNESDFNMSTLKNMVQKTVGSGVHTKLILSPLLSQNNKHNEVGGSCAIPVTTIEFASLCLRNALLLINDHIVKAKAVPPSPNPPAPVGAGVVNMTTPSSGESSQPMRLPGPNLGGLIGLGGTGAVPSLNMGAGSRMPPVQEGCYAAPSSPMYKTEVENLKCSVLAASAYVALCLGDYVIALQHATELLIQNRLSGAHKLLGHLYSAEALIMANKISEAIEHLSPSLIKDVAVQFPANSESNEKEKEKEKEKDRDAANQGCAFLKPWSPSTLGTARAVLEYNLSVAFAIRGEYDKAGETLTRVYNSRGPLCEVPAHVMMLVMYLELQLGHTDVSRNIIKQHCPQLR